LRNYVVATVKPWNIEYFKQWQSAKADHWHLLSQVDQLNLQNLNKINPKYIFFPHWSWIVPKEILSRFECVCFHMTDVPYGRGGSPLQNLIIRNHKKTKISALRMTEHIDAGPVYLKAELSLEGSAQKIYERATPIIFKMIENIITQAPIAVAQKGKLENFSRRTPEQSTLPTSGELNKLYDHIRMLDAHSYPHAKLDHGDFELQFKDAKLANDTLSATVYFKKKSGSQN
jgi:methionyl-tRNA formyltransferase